MQPQLQIQGVNVVIRGSFNAAIFQPSWMARHNLIKSQEADAADIKIISSQMAVFEVEWFQLQIVPDRFQIETVHESHYEALRDLVVGVLLLLPHTPLRMLGINRDFHYRMSSEAAWHAVGHVLAPMQPWEEFLAQPGMRSLSMQGERPDDYKGYIDVRVEPSARERPGVYVRVNDHYQVREDSKSTPAADQMVDILQNQWRVSMERGLRIADNIVGIGQQE